MIKPKLNLSFSNRLSVRESKRRVGSPLAKVKSTFSQITQIRSGSKISRLFRHVFESKNIKKILGSNIALAIIATSGVPGPALANTIVEPQAEVAIIKAVDAPLTTTVTGARPPVAEIKVTQKFRTFHPGVDLDGKTGDPIKPIQAGRVQKVAHSRFGYGNAVYIDHGNGVTSLYAHLSKIYVKEGDQVTTETVIGAMGSTGRSTGDHLHLEVKVNGRPINPLAVMGLE